MTLLLTPLLLHLAGDDDALMARSPSAHSSSLGDEFSFANHQQLSLGWQQLSGTAVLRLQPEDEDEGEEEGEEEGEAGEGEVGEGDEDEEQGFQGEEGLQYEDGMEEGDEGEEGEEGEGEADPEQEGEARAAASETGSGEADALAPDHTGSRADGPPVPRDVLLQAQQYAGAVFGQGGGRRSCSQSLSSVCHGARAEVCR